MQIDALDGYSQVRTVKRLPMVLPATRQKDRKPNQFLHVFIPPQIPATVDTQHWVFFPCAPPIILENMGSKTRFLLTGSMAGLLLLTAVTGAAALAAFSRIHVEEAGLRVRSLANSRRLEQVRAAIYLSAADTQSPA